MSKANLEMVRRLLAAGRRDDLSASLDCLDPELVWVPLRAATEGAYRGHEGFQQFVEDTNETFETFEPQFELRDVGSKVLAWGTIHVRGKGSGIETDIPFGGVFEFRGERIVRWQDFGSKEKALEAATQRE